jgi:hypothetical protein
MTFIKCVNNNSKIYFQFIIKLFNKFKYLVITETATVLKKQAHTR